MIVMLQNYSVLQLIDVKVGKTPLPKNRFKIMEGGNRGKKFVRYKKKTLEFTPDLQRRITIEEEIAAAPSAK